MAKAFKIKSNLSEKQIESDVSNFLGLFSSKVSQRGIQHRLLDTNEQLTGADKEYRGINGVLIYIQFKKSEGLQSLSSVPLPENDNKNPTSLTPLQKIRKFRDDNKLGDDPTLYFQLRSKSKTATDFQHNVLFSHHKPKDDSYAIYTAPLILDKDKYYEQLKDSFNKGNYLKPFYFRKYYLYHGNDFSVFKFIRFLLNHVAITPHERVHTHEHYYAYSETATDISWHSPSIVSREVSRLSDFMGNLDRRLLSVEDLPPFESLVTNAIRTSSEFGFKTESSSLVEQLVEHGKWLKSNYDISQFLFIRENLY